MTVSVPRRIAAVAIALLLAANLAAAQVVRGRVVESLAAAPIGGAVVWLSDSAGALVSRSITDSAGSFVLPRLRGATRFNVVRIGFRPREMAMPVADSAIDVRLEAVAALLEGVRVYAGRGCPRDRRGPGGFELWEQARAALLATLVSREMYPPRIRLIASERTRDPILGRVMHQQVSTKNVTVERSYVAARPAWAFAAEGYMTEDAGKERTFYAPDSETLLDPSFAATHCLTVAKEDAAHPGQIGVAFEPVTERDTVVDVRGVLWIDRAKPALRSLEFQYTGLEPIARGSGGEITFLPMPNGVAMIQRWIIRSVMIAMDSDERYDRVRRELPPRSLRRNTRNIGTRESSGEIASVEWRDGRTWFSRLPRISGIVTDHEGRTVAGARVWLMEGSDTVATNADGHFILPPVLPGVHAVLASDSTFARAGLARTSHHWVTLLRDTSRVAPIRLHLHPREVLLGHLCQGQASGNGTGVILGRAVTSAGVAMANAEIELWRQVTAANVELFRNEPGGIAGKDGRFVICGIPLGGKIRIRASGAGETGETWVDAWGDDLFVASIVGRAAK